MDKNRIQIIITSVLILIFVIVWANAIKVFKKKSALNTRASTVESVNAVPYEIKKEPEVPKDSEIVKEDISAWGRCPFSGKIYTAGKGGIADLRLGGVIWDEFKPMAIINNDVVRIGDKIGSNKVIDIKKDYVIVNDGIKDYKLKLEE